MSYVKRNPDLEKRKEKFFRGYRDEVEANIIHNAMYKIGFFQLAENNLNHIKGVQNAAENSIKHKLKVEKAKAKEALKR